MRIINAAQIVSKILELNPGARDNDNLLMKLVWTYQSKRLYKNLKPSSSTFWDDFVKGKFYAPESITRARRKLQEINPNLRGKTYIKRHENQEVVKQQIKDFKL